MYSIEQFNQRLQEEFGGRLRLRQSLTRESTFYLEERTGRATYTGIADLRDRSTLQARRRADDRLRAAEGYSKVMEVQAGTKSACTRCGFSYQVPQLHTAEVRCLSCNDQIYTAFFPLGETFLDYLKERDPERVDQERRVREEARRAEWLRKCEEEGVGREAGEAFRDTLIEQIPAARLSGRTAFWESDDVGKS